MEYFFPSFDSNETSIKLLVVQFDRSLGIFFFLSDRNFLRKLGEKRKHTLRFHARGIRTMNYECVSRVCGSSTFAEKAIAFLRAETSLIHFHVTFISIETGVRFEFRGRNPRYCISQEYTLRIGSKVQLQVDTLAKTKKWKSVRDHITSNAFFLFIITRKEKIEREKF